MRRLVPSATILSDALVWRIRSWSAGGSAVVSIRRRPAVIISFCITGSRSVSARFTPVVSRPLQFLRWFRSLSCMAVHMRTGWTLLRWLVRITTAVHHQNVSLTVPPLFGSQTDNTREQLPISNSSMHWHFQVNIMTTGWYFVQSKIIYGYTHYADNDYRYNITVNSEYKYADFHHFGASVFHYFGFELLIGYLWHNRVSDATVVLYTYFSISIYFVQYNNIWQQQMQEQTWRGWQGTERALTAALTKLQ